MVPIGPLAPWNKLNTGPENQTLIRYFRLWLSSPKKIQAYSVSLITICEFEIWGDTSSQHRLLWTCSQHSCRLLLRPISQSIFLPVFINVQYLLPFRTSIIQHWISFLNSTFCAVVQLSAPYLLFSLWCVIGLPSPLAGYNSHSSTSRDPARPYTHHDFSTRLASFGCSAAFSLGAVGKCQDSKHLFSK